MNYYIEKKIGFYFGKGGFDQMIIEAQLDQDDIEKWGSLAVLFDHCFGDVSNLTSEEKNDAISLIEVIYIELEVDKMFDEEDESSVNEVLELCKDCDFDTEKYKEEIEKGVKLIEEEGLELYKKIER